MQPFLSKGTHIVGGEFQIIWTGQDDFYNVFMNMYFDDIHGDPGLFTDDINIYASVYRKSDQAFMTNVQLTRYNIDFIPNVVTGCHDLSLIRTRLFRYAGIADFKNYLDPGGYYIVWERCCRNNNISNIFLPQFTGEVFYLQFTTTYLKNSTPYFKPLNNQFWCRGTTHYLDFSGVDPNGDQLRYELVTPMAGNSSLGNPSPNFPYQDRTQPEPYQPVIWLPGFGPNAQINGSVPLSINPTSGLLTFNSSSVGLFVFAVKVSEYRLGIKIGECIRDFQLLIQNCPVNAPPQIALDKTFSNGIGHVEMFINEVKSLDLFLADATTTSLFLPEHITFVSVMSNLPEGIFQISNAVMLFPGRDTVQTQLLISPCGLMKIDADRTERVRIVVRDNRCPPRYDTLVFDLTIKVPVNSPPDIQIIPNDGPNYTLYPGDILNFLVKATDPDPSDLLILVAEGVGFNLSDYWMTFHHITSLSPAVSNFQWRVGCDFVNKGPWVVRFSVIDNSCMTTHIDWVDVTLNVFNRETNVDQYKPINLITANGDGMNDSFFLYNPPVETCDTYFKSIAVYNSWGSRVFYDHSRDFIWKPDANQNGIYYYYFDYNDRSLKGWIQVIGAK